MVKDYQLTYGTAFHKTERILQKIVSGGAEIELIFIDNCCHVRAKLKELFPTASVKLDLSHAVARLTLHMPKRHPFYHEATCELGLVFREEDDISGDRKGPTAAPAEIQKNNEDFLRRWKPINFKGWKIMNDKVENEFEKLMLHVKIGYLSGIPRGMGTNRNENLHKQLRQFVRNKLAVQTAEALFTHIFYLRNCRANNLEVVPPIWSQHQNIQSEMQHFQMNDIEDPQAVEVSDVHQFFSTAGEDQSTNDHDYSGKGERSFVFTI